MTMPMPAHADTVKKKTTTAARKKTPARTHKAAITPAKKKTAAKKPAVRPAAIKPSDTAPTMTMPMPVPPARDTIRKSVTDSSMGAMPGMTMTDSTKMVSPDTAHRPTATDHTSMSGMVMPAANDSTAAMAPHPMSADAMMIGPLGISMDRMGSGTTWIPDAVTMPSRRTMMGSWMIMAHGFAFAQYDKQTGKRGDDQIGSLNWAMLMATKTVAGGRFQARTMLSLDALTVTSRGYPLLLQTGEVYQGVALHDRQHPHDFWMELGALYQRQFSKTLGWSVYAAPSGEPALGPVAFMHRPSAMDNPTAPIGHHWQDATHVSFGTTTVGLFGKTWQVEGSAFNGREPDQNRWNFDPLKLDSYSGRVTLNPTESWSFSGGYGYLKSPEALNPAESIHRVSASILHGARVGTDGQWASTFIWGANKFSGSARLAHSLLGETEAILDHQNTIFARSELVQKSAEDLVLDASLSGGNSMRTFNVGTAEIGYIREIARTRWATWGIGAAGTVNFVPSALADAYGSRSPKGLLVFLRLRPFHTQTHETGAMSGMKMRTATDE